MINSETHSSVSVNMPNELYAALKILAANNKRSVSATICLLVENELKRVAIK